MLLLLVVAIILLTIYGIATNKVTPEERDEMLNDENIFP